MLNQNQRTTKGVTMQSYGTPSIGIRAVKKINPLRIGWVAPFDLDAAQTRIRVINIHRRLTSIGWDSKIISFEQALSSRFDIVIVGKDFSEYAYNSILQLKPNSYIIADICEDLLDMDIPYYKEIISISDKVISASHYLTSRLKRINPNTETIQDAIETDLALNCSYKNTRPKVVYLGYGGNSYLANNYRHVIESCGMDLVVITEHDDADIKWNRNTWVQHVLDCDIAFIPQRPDQPSKSNNKCTQLMALGLPVIANHHPAYEPLIQHGKNGFFYEYIDDLKNILLQLKDFSKRYEIGISGKKQCSDFTIPAITNQWTEKFIQIQKKVDIIIATYNNLKYLKTTLESIKQCTTYPYNILVVDSGTDDTHDYCKQNNIPIIYSEKRLTFAEANNLGIQSTNNHYICLLNNDVIVTHGWLHHLVAATDIFDLVGPFSNCDKHWQHEIDYEVDGIQLVPAMKMEDFPDITKIYNVQGLNQLISRHWVAFYCTLAKREVFNAIGKLDTGFRNNAEDCDFSERANLLGYKCGQNYNSYVFHFGGKTRKVSEIENYETHHIDDKESSAYFNKKYANETVVIWQGPSYVPWDDRNLEIGNIGGSEVWTIHLAREFDKLGYRVIVFNDCPNMKKSFGNIEYVHWTEFGNWQEMNFIHHFISSRSLEPFKLNIRAKNKFCVLHDIWIMLNEQNDIVYKDRVDKFFCLSKRHKEFVVDHHKIEENKILITANGIDFARFQDTNEDKRNQFH